MTSTLSVAGEDRQLFVQPDVIDLRDRYYTPALVALPQELKPLPHDLEIRNQRKTSACTGFALASVIDRQCKQVFNRLEAPKASPRMLFEMARLHDDLPDEAQAGSTLRGALKGFFHNGVCREEQAPFDVAPGAPPFSLTLDLAEKAREISLGAYFRLNHEINDYHTAIKEAGAIIASAKIHSGWAKPEEGVIRLSNRHEGRHAFAIVGYDAEGFLIQNSWGPDWSRFAGLQGVARWDYQDWFENVEDAWVLRLAISSPKAFSVKYARNHAVFRKDDKAASAFNPRRQDIMGHFLHIDDGKLVRKGRYAQTTDSVDAIVDRLAGIAGDRNRDFDHVLLVAHGALQDSAAIASRAKAWLPVFRRNRIYPVHLMWETGFNNNVVNVIRDLLFKTRARMGAEDEHLDERLEALARPLGRKLWRDLATTARLVFEDGTESGTALQRIIAAAQGLKLHFASQSAGAFLLGGCLSALERDGQGLQSAILMAPACSVDFYDAHVRPHVGRRVARISQYSLIDKREREDGLDVYGKSLLYLVSNAIEAETATPLLGMEQFILGTKEVKAMAPLPKRHRVYFAGRDRAVTESRTHPGFDKDRKTMNHLLETVLGAKPPAGFQEGELTGY